MGDLDLRTVLVTGANTGIGRATARVLAARGAKVFLACRSEAKTKLVIDEISAQTGNTHLEFLPLDLGDLSSVRACASAFLSAGEPLHVLINNAGLAGQRGITVSGFELAFGTNYVGPFLLTSLLLDQLRDSAPARIVNVASGSALQRHRDRLRRRAQVDEESDGNARIRSVEAGQRAPRPGAGAATRRDPSHHLRASSGSRRVRYLASRAVAGAGADETEDALAG